MSYLIVNAPEPFMHLKLNLKLNRFCSNLINRFSKIVRVPFEKKVFTSYEIFLLQVFENLLLFALEIKIVFLNFTLM